MNVDLSNFYKVLFISALYLVLICSTIIQLRKKHAGTVQTIWYFFSLAGWATFLIGVWVSGSGAIDAHGKFLGAAGENITKIFDFMMDLNTDAIVVLALVSLVIVPQLISYILSAPFGCSTNILFFEGGISFAIWSLAKSFTVASGILAFLVPVGYYYGWSGFREVRATGLLSFALMLLMLSFTTIWAYYEAAEMIARIINQFPFVKSFVKRIHKIATRHRTDTTDQGPRIGLSVTVEVSTAE